MVDEEDAPLGPRADLIVEYDLLLLAPEEAEAIATDLRRTIQRSQLVELIATALKPHNVPRQSLLAIPRAASLTQRQEYERVSRWANQQADKEQRAEFARALLNALDVAKM